MNLYLLLIICGTKRKPAWQAGDNAGEILNNLDKIGVDVIEIQIMPPSMHETVRAHFPSLDYVIKGMQAMLDYKNI